MVANYKTRTSERVSNPEVTLEGHAALPLLIRHASETTFVRRYPRARGLALQFTCAHSM